MYQSIRFLCTGADRQREHLFYTPDPRICSQTSHLKVSLKKPRLQPRETEAATSAWTLSDRLTSPRNSTAIGLDIFDYASGKRRASTDDRSGGGLSSMGFMTMGGAHSMSTGLTSLMRFESRFLGDRRRLALDQNLDHDHDHDQDHYSVIGVRHDLWSQDEQSIEESWGMDMEKVRPHTTTSLTWCASGQAIASTSTASIGDVTMSHQHQFVGSSHSKVVPHMCLHHKRNDRAGIKKTLYDMSECSLDPPMTSTGPVNFLAAYETRLVESEGCGSCQLRCRSEQEIQMYWSRVEVSLDWVLAGMAPISTVSTKMRPAEKDCR
ncbi:hypothetical protein BGZ94_002469 [Podila epigama]|nr:hypothetical protein BGZ94_002469 [Podila epigama]